MDGTGLLFAPLVAALPASLAPRVVAYPPDVPLGYDELDEIVGAALPTAGPFLLLGESFSGPLAIRAAARRPAGLAGVILVATFATSPYPRVLRRFVRPWMFRCGGSLRSRVLLGSDPDRPVADILQKAVGSVTPDVFARRAREVLSVDATLALRACPVPILVLWGTRDRVVPGRSLARVREQVPEAKIVTLDAPHLVLQARPREAAQAIVAFAAGLT